MSARPHEAGREAAPLLVVTGTGTEIGKTHLATALLMAWARTTTRDGRPAKIAGLKPVETGIRPTGAAAATLSDAQTLERASTFHVKQPAPYRLRRAVSPHLAARNEGLAIALEPIRAYVARVRAEADGVLVELAGGLFSPLAPGLSNADVASALAPDRVLLVAPDRLGVLHDVAATTRAAAACGLALSGIVLVAPAIADTSTGTNAEELALVSDLPVLARLPRATVEELATRADVARLFPAR